MNCKIIEMEDPVSEKSDKRLNLFKAISNFVTNLNDCYGPKQKSLQLYGRLISKTTIADDVPINRHIEGFNKFCSENKEAILNKSANDIKVDIISYNEKVYINIKNILKQSDKSEQEIIWKHLLAIYALIDPHSRAKEKLKDVLEKDKKTSGKESDFLFNIFDKVGNTMESSNLGESTGNPMEAITKMMSSGVFTDIVGSMSEGLESGDLDLGKLMGSMQGMVSSIGDMAKDNSSGSNPEMDMMLNQMNQMMGNLTSSTEGININNQDMMQGRDFASQIFNKMENNVEKDENNVLTGDIDNINKTNNVNEEERVLIEEMVEPEKIKTTKKREKQKGETKTEKKDKTKEKSSLKTGEKRMKTRRQKNEVSKEEEKAERRRQKKCIKF